MARRVDWYDDDNEEDFEILNEPSSSKTPEKFEFIEEDFFEIVACQNKPGSSSSINSNPISSLIVIDKPVPPPAMKIDKPVLNEVKQSPENSPPLSTNATYFPVRYGSAAIIPHNDGFDFKSILSSKPLLPKPSNDLISILQNDQSKKRFLTENTLQEIVIANDHNRQSLIQLAKQAQQDFINAIQLN